MSESHTLAAKRTLVYYFRKAFEAAGLKWEADNRAEIESAVEDLLNGAYDSARDLIDEHEENHEHRERSNR